MASEDRVGERLAEALADYRREFANQLKPLIIQTQKNRVAGQGDLFVSERLSLQGLRMPDGRRAEPRKGPDCLGLWTSDACSILIRRSQADCTGFGRVCSA